MTFFPLKLALWGAFSHSAERTAQPICTPNGAKWPQNWYSMLSSDFRHFTSRIRDHQVKISEKIFFSSYSGSLCYFSHSFERTAQPICTPNGAKWPQSWVPMRRSNCQHLASRMRDHQVKILKKKFFPLLNWLIVRLFPLVWANGSTDLHAKWCKMTAKLSVKAT